MITRNAKNEIQKKLLNLNNKLIKIHEDINSIQTIIDQPVEIEKPKVKPKEFVKDCLIKTKTGKLHVINNFWTNQENCILYLNWLKTILKLKTKNDFKKLNRKDFISNHGLGLINKYNGSLNRLTNELLDFVDLKEDNFINIFLPQTRVINDSIE